MEQFLKKIFNDNSVCVGLCDLKRKVDEINFSYSKLQPQVQQTIQQKPQKQSLAQIFAEQQRVYAEQKAVAQQQEQIKRQMYTQQRQSFEQAQQQIQYRKKLQQQVSSTDAKILYTNRNPYAPQSAIQQNSQSKVIVNGSMKKVISAAVPAQRYM